MIISRAIKESKWVDIDYINGNGENTNFWCSIVDVKIEQKKLSINMFNYHKSMNVLNTDINFDSIKIAKVIEFSYYDVDVNLIRKLETYDCEWLKYDSFNNNILMYLAECNKLDNDPFQKDYSLVEGIDYRALLTNKKYQLNDEQVKKIIKDIYHLDINKSDNSFCNLALNILSIDVDKKLYVVAYQHVCFNPINKSLCLNGDIIINKSFLIDKKKHSLSSYLNIDIEEFVTNFTKNKREYTELIRENLRGRETIDELPKLMVLEKEIVVDLYSTYESIENKHSSNSLSVPLKCFFGNNSSRYKGKKEPTIILKSKKTNIDQVRVVYNAMKNPVTYVQGPPGTGKTSTIENVVLSSFINNKSCLIVSNNNKPIDGIYEKLKFKYNGKEVPFPVLRLGNKEETLKAIERIKEFYKIDTTSIVIRENLLEKIKEETGSRYGELTSLLKEYEDKTRHRENKELLERFTNKIQEKKGHERLYYKLKEEIAKLNSKIDGMHETTNEEVLEYAVPAEENHWYMQYLYYESYKYILKLQKSTYKDLIDIIYIENEDERLVEFNRYLKDDKNLVKFINVFPFIITTNISANKLGSVNCFFDICIMDEAGQCNIATALIPICRANNLLLIGDPNQLQPVVVLESKINQELMKKYDIKPVYDYCNNSIIKLMKEKDNISQHILLRYHYRCSKKIIKFCNDRYYESKLNIETKEGKDELEFVDVKNDLSHENRNSYYSEAKAVVNYIKESGFTDIGVVTPFRNQASLINKMLKDEGRDDIIVGTIHQFQGGEKNLIVMSPSISIKSSKKTYEWLANNQELINVGMSRAKEKFVIVGDKEAIDIFSNNKNDDIKSLCDYVKSNGNYKVVPSEKGKINIGFSNGSEYEDQLFETLSHFCSIYKRFYIDRNVKIKELFESLNANINIYDKGEFDFVLYKKNILGKKEPALIIELNGGEHIFSDNRRNSDRQKKNICEEKGIEFMILPNEYAKSYEYLTDLILKMNNQNDQMSFDSI